MGVINFISTQIFGNAAFLFGIISLIGLLLLKKSFEDVITGTVKTIVGVLILFAGCDVLSASVTPLGEWIKSVLGVQGVLPNALMMMSMVMSKYGAILGAVVVVGFLVNIIMARITKLKYIALVGHLFLNWGAFVVGTLVALNVSPAKIILIGGIFCGIYFWLCTAATHHFMKKNENLTKDFALYIPEATGIAFTSWFSSKVGNKENRCDDIKVPKKLEWLRDNVVGIAVLGAILWVLFGILVGKDVIAKSAGSTNWILYLVTLGIKFSVGLSIVLYGVRMMLAEIVPAFRGIATKVVPGAIPGLDYPTIFQFSPNAVFVGFIANLIGGILGTLVLVYLKAPVVVIPSVWTNFWMGSVLGVFGDAYGGRRGAILSNIIVGFVITFLWAVAYPMSGWCTTTGLLPDYTDYGVIGTIFEFIAKLIAK